MKLGHTYKDKITGFQGIAVGHVVYMTGCNQTLLAPSAKEDGDYVSARWFDDQRLELLHKDPIVLHNGNNPGSDIPAPIK